jgi:F-type H+-transporting ATPase subunit a
MVALDFPPISQLTEWRTLFGHGAFAVNKVVLLEWLAVLIVFGFFFVAGRRQRLVPRGVQNMAEAVVEFIQNGIIFDTIGPEGLGFTPLLLTLFAFIFVCNIFEVIPIIQMPVTARMGLPLFMTAIVFVLYNVVGVRSQGVLGYVKSSLVPPGVSAGFVPLVALNHAVQVLFARPFSLAVRLFANLLAGHLLLVTFSLLSAALFSSTYIGAVIPGALLVALYAFEVLVSILQAFIFTMLTAVYIGGAMHPEH